MACKRLNFGLLGYRQHQLAGMEPFRAVYQDMASCASTDRDGTWTELRCGIVTRGDGQGTVRASQLEYEEYFTPYPLKWEK